MEDPGNTTCGSTERPLVSVLVLGFNQERFIRKAVEGAFAQTWKPLEIVLSDDCSTDRTFEISTHRSTPIALRSFASARTSCCCTVETDTPNRSATSTCVQSYP